jgi:hypothetical protein
MTVYRAGPWPGLTPRGATVLLGCAVLLAVGQLALGNPRRAWPDLLLLGVMSLAPLALATRITRVPGAASAACGAYLLPRALVSLIDPNVDLPPLLLVPALAFDLSAWLSPDDLKNAWWWRRSVWRRRDRRPRRIGFWRAVLAGAIFGVVLSIVEPPFAILLGGDAAAWSGMQLWLAGSVTAISCALLGLIARGTES